jgi:hypothetical protein
MLFKPLLGAILSAALVAAQSDSEVVAVFLLGRHGDRTSRIFSMGVEGSSVLTTLGMNQVYETGIFWHNKYFDPSSPDAIQGLNSTYRIPQIYASAPYLSVTQLYTYNLEMTMPSSLLQLHFSKDSTLHP